MKRLLIFIFCVGLCTVGFSQTKEKSKTKTDNDGTKTKTVSKHEGKTHHVLHHRKHRRHIKHKAAVHHKKYKHISKNGKSKTKTKD